MIKRYRTKKELFLLNMVLFIGFSFEFFIRNDNFLGLVLIFNGFINLLAFQQAPRKIATITVILNLFNALLSLTVAYNYSLINYFIPYFFWLVVFLVFLFFVFRQIINLLASNRSRQKQKRKFD